MNIIRDDEMGGLMMIPLFYQWRINRCNVKGCHEKPTTIISGLIATNFGLCEKHYVECKKKEKTEFDLDFNELVKA